MSSVMSTLRDGSQVLKVTVDAVMSNLMGAREDNMIAVVDLVERCRDDSFSFFANPFCDSRLILRKYELINERGEVHDEVKKVVLNAVQGEDLSLKLVSPLFQEAREVTVVKKTELSLQEILARTSRD